jgi:hypothetical protein
MTAHASTGATVLVALGGIALGTALAVWVHRRMR